VNKIPCQTEKSAGAAEKQTEIRLSGATTASIRVSNVKLKATEPFPSPSPPLFTHPLRLPAKKPSSRFFFTCELLAKVGYFCKKLLEFNNKLFLYNDLLSNSTYIICCNYKNH